MVIVRPPTEGEGESSHGRMTRLHTQTEGESSRHGMTRPPDRMGASKSWEPPQRPDPDGGRTDAGGGEGTKTHPPPNPPGSAHLMSETARRNKAQRGDRTRRRRRGRKSEPAARVTRKHTPLARLLSHRWEVHSPRGPRRPRKREMAAQGTRQHNLSARLRLCRWEAQSTRGRRWTKKTHRGGRGGGLGMEL